MTKSKTLAHERTHTANIFKWFLAGAIFVTRLVAFFSSTTKLHNARFARIDELENLLGHPSGQDTSLLLAQRAE